GRPPGLPSPENHRGPGRGRGSAAVSARCGTVYRPAGRRARPAGHGSLRVSGRRRAGDEFDDERAWSAGRPPRGYRPPPDARVADRTPPPWQAVPDPGAGGHRTPPRWQAVPDYGPGAGEYGRGAGEYGRGAGDYGPGAGENGR